MDSERFREVKRIFQAALEAEGASRQALVQEACAGDEALRREVESLLVSLEEAEDFIEKPAVGGSRVRRLFEDESPDDEPPEDQSLVGRRIGPYQLLHQLDRGGMGVVYAAATDGGLTPQVAIKLVHRKAERLVQGRFRQEWQILSRLHHPNIAQLLDAGTTDEGRPYFVMEYVEGEPILTYCDQRRLPVSERLRLVVKICSALEAAHRQSILHRDVKPDNVLVRRDGEPKLLDFGVAKLLRPELTYETVFATAPGMRWITPEYASPEQAKDEVLTPVSDVYSLGVVLYELLTGHRPYRIERYTAPEIMRVICQEVPEMPSRVVLRPRLVRGHGETTEIVTPESVSALRSSRPDALARCLEGGLDAILGKALDKDPASRHATVRALADDIETCLEAQPVSVERTWWLQATVRRDGHVLFRDRIFQSPIRIGAGSDNEIVLAASHVSGRHAHVLVSSDRVVFHDHSRNGSFVDGERVRECDLASETVVSIPPFELSFELFDSDEARQTLPGVTETPAMPALPRYLHFVAPDGLRNRSFRLRGSRLRIGRDSEADIQVEAATLSRFHAALALEADTWWIVDLESSNGTYLNRRRIGQNERRPLQVGDRIVLGDLVFVFGDRDEAPQ